MMEEQALRLCVPSLMKPPCAPVLVTDEAGVERAVSFLERLDAYGYDLETNIVDDFIDRKIRTMQFGNKEEQYVIDLLAFCESSEQLINAQGDCGARLYTAPRLEKVINRLRPYLEHHILRRLIVGQNLAFEYTTTLWSFGVRIWNLYSIDIAEKNIYAGLVGFFEKGWWALDDMVARYCALKISKEEQTSFDLVSPLTEAQVVYAGLDTRLPMAVRVGQLPTLSKYKLEQAVKIDNDAIGSFCDLHMSGLLVDNDAWLAIIQEIETTHYENIKRLDEFFIPFYGNKNIPQHDLTALEAEWRALSIDGCNELELKAKKKATKDKEEKALIAAEIEVEHAARCAARDAARKAFMAARSAISEATKKFDSYQGEAAFNYGSKPAMLVALRKMCKLSENQLPNTNDKTLEKLAAKHPVIAALQEYRTTEKALDNYGYQWITAGEYVDERTGKKKKGHINPLTGRIHSRFNLLGAATGRTSSDGPNVQNLPKEKKIRRCFKARPGYKIITADWSGCELRIIAEMSGFEPWIAAFNNDWDLHELVCEMMHELDFQNGIVHTPYTIIKDGKEKVIPKCAYIYGNAEGHDHVQCECPVHVAQRNGIKPMNFGIAYGLTSYGLAPKLGVDEDTAQERINKYNKANWGIITFLEGLSAHAQMHFEARTMCGRRRLFKKPTYEEAERIATEKYGRRPTTKEVVRTLKGLQSSIAREGRNMPIQGTNADMAKLAMGCGFDKNGVAFLWHTLPKYGARFVNMVHDELVVECPEEHVEECKREIGSAMIRAGAEFVSKVTMTYEMKVADYWEK